MNLNLGIESLSAVNTNNVIPFTATSAAIMVDLSASIESLCGQLDDIYTGAQNAMHIRRTINKYGKTQSLVALVGNEAIDVAQTFSMEGFWQKVKDVLVAIWTKIKEWWNRFWGMFFGSEKRITAAASTFQKGKQLTQDIEYDGQSADTIRKEWENQKGMIDKIVAMAHEDFSLVQYQTKEGGEIDKFDNSADNGLVSSKLNLETRHIKFTSCSECATEAKKLKDLIKEISKEKGKIDGYTEKALKVLNKSWGTKKVETEEEKENAKRLDTIARCLRNCANITKGKISALCSLANKMASILASKTSYVK